MGTKYWIKTGVQHVDELYVIDGDGTPITGILDAQWVKVLYNPSGIDVSGSITVTVTELGDGIYRVTFTPNVDGSWALVLENVANDVRFSSNYQSAQNTTDDIADDIADIADDIAALNDLSIADVQTAMTNQGYTTARALLLDNLDATISSVLSAIAALNNLSQADVQAAMTAQGYTTVRAALLDNLDASISGVPSAVDAVLTAAHGSGSWTSATDVDWTAEEKNQIRFRLAMDGTQSDPTTGTGTIEDILTDTTAIDGRLPADPADESNQLAAHAVTQGLITALNDLSIADVQTALTNQGYTTVRAALLDNLDSPITAVLAAIAALNDLSQSDIQAALDAQGYTSARAAMIELAKQMLINRLELEEGDVDNWVLYADDDTTPLLTFSVTDKDDVAVFLPSRAPARRTRGT
jgi:hypothetical protein